MLRIRGQDPGADAQSGFLRNTGLHGARKIFDGTCGRIIRSGEIAAAVDEVQAASRIDADGAELTVPPLVGWRVGERVIAGAFVHGAVHGPGNIVVAEDRFAAGGEGQITHFGFEIV